MYGDSHRSDGRPPPRRDFASGTQRDDFRRPVSRDVVRCQNCDGKGHNASACPSPPMNDPHHSEPTRGQNYSSNRHNENRPYHNNDEDRNGRGSYENRSYGGANRYDESSGERERSRAGERRDDNVGYGNRTGGQNTPRSDQPCRRCGDSGHLPYACPRRVGATETDAADAKPYRSVIELTDDDMTSRIGRGINFSRYNKIQVQVRTSHGTPDESAQKLQIHSFEQARLDAQLMETIRKLGYEVPTPVQQYAIPIALTGRDIMACAQTGSGKTAAFVIPTMQALLNSNIPEPSRGPQRPLALILAPTRELVVQITKDAKLYGQRTQLHVKECYGGTHVRTQIDNISRGCHILVGTTGRIKDFVDRRVVSFDNLRFLVFDEADRMLDMGFEPDIRSIKEQFPRDRKPQTLMFSATFKADVQGLASEYLARDYVKLDVGVVGANEDVDQKVEKLSGLGSKRTRLVEIIKDELSQNPRAKLLVFVETKKTADFLATYLSELNRKTTSIHGDRYVII